jgi:hypothetical protein
MSMSDRKEFDILSFQKEVIERLRDLQSLYGSPPTKSFSPATISTDMSRIEEDVGETIELLEKIGFKDFVTNMKEYATKTMEEKELTIEAIGHKITHYKHWAWALINHKLVKEYIHHILKDDELDADARALSITRNLVRLDESQKIHIEMDPMLFAMITLWGEYIVHYKIDY